MRIDWLSSKTGSCTSAEIRSPWRLTTCPSSGSIVLAMIPSRVDLPVPLMPTMPMRSVSSRPTVTSVRMGLVT